MGIDFAGDGAMDATMSKMTALDNSGGSVKGSGQAIDFAGDGSMDVGGAASSAMDTSGSGSKGGSVIDFAGDV